jgi:hypothetical protein
MTSPQHHYGSRWLIRVAAFIQPLRATAPPAVGPKNSPAPADLTVSITARSGTGSSGGGKLLRSHPGEQRYPERGELSAAALVQG